MEKSINTILEVNDLNLTKVITCICLLSAAFLVGYNSDSEIDKSNASNMIIEELNTTIPEPTINETTILTTTTTTETTTSTTITTASTTSTTSTTTETTTTTTETTTIEVTTTMIESTTVSTESIIEEPVSYEYSWYSDGENFYFEPSGWIIDSISWYALCNCVANEAGSYWISEYNKALVCEVIFNRKEKWGYESVYDVISAPNQFTGSSKYINLGNQYSKDVNDGVINAVAFYCSYPNIFNEGYLYFTGDGRQNHFH